MRELLPAPLDAVDPAGRVVTGSFRGSVRHLDLSALGRSRLARVKGEKRWVYVALVTEKLFVSVCVVRMGYAAKLFGFVYDADRRTMLTDVSRMAPPFAATVGESALVSDVARYRSGKDEVRFTRDVQGHELVARVGSVRVDARMSDAGPPAITAVARIGPGGAGAYQATEKRALLPLDGEIYVGGARYSLAGGLGGYDYSAGFPGRRTRWHWAFGMGHDAVGEPVAFNLVEGFVGAPECAVWHRGEVHGVGEGRFSKTAPMDPWRVTTDASEAELAFDPGALHAENVNFGVIRSRFVQPVGSYAGTLSLGDTTIALGKVLGVAEDQDVLW